MTREIWRGIEWFVRTLLGTGVIYFVPDWSNSGQATIGVLLVLVVFGLNDIYRALPRARP